MAALRATCELLPLTPEWLIKAPKSGRNNNEEQNNPARIRRHHARRGPRIHIARAVCLGADEEIRSGCQRYRNQARADGSALRSRLALRRARSGRRGLFPDAE